MLAAAYEAGDERSILRRLAELLTVTDNRFVRVSVAPAVFVISSIARVS